MPKVQVKLHSKEIGGFSMMAELFYVMLHFQISESEMDYQ